MNANRFELRRAHQPAFECGGHGDLTLAVLEEGSIEPAVAAVRWSTSLLTSPQRNTRLRRDWLGAIVCRRSVQQRLMRKPSSKSRRRRLPPCNGSSLRRWRNQAKTQMVRLRMLFCASVKLSLQVFQSFAQRPTMNRLRAQLRKRWSLAAVRLCSRVHDRS